MEKIILCRNGCIKISIIYKLFTSAFTFDNNYFNALYQGISVSGYTQTVANMLDGIEAKLDVDYLKHKDERDKFAKKVIYMGSMDTCVNYFLSYLECRFVRFENEIRAKPNFHRNTPQTIQIVKRLGYTSLRMSSLN